MNGAQQRQHRRATDTLAQVITETQGAVVERFEEMEASVAAMHEKVTQLVGDERTHRLKLADEQRAYVDAADRALRTCCDDRWLATTEAQRRLFLWQTEYDALTFWGRLRWLVTGWRV